MMQSCDILMQKMGSREAGFEKRKRLHANMESHREIY